MLDTPCPRSSLCVQIKIFHFNVRLEEVTSRNTNVMCNHFLLPNGLTSTLSFLSNHNFKANNLNKDSPT